jgi:hypothetical protein
VIIFYFIKRNLAFSYFKTISFSNEVHEPYSDPLIFAIFMRFWSHHSNLQILTNLEYIRDCSYIKILVILGTEIIMKI